MEKAKNFSVGGFYVLHRERIKSMPLSLNVNRTETDFRKYYRCAILSIECFLSLFEWYPVNLDRYLPRNTQRDCGKKRF